MNLHINFGKWKLIMGHPIKESREKQIGMEHNILKFLFLM